MQPCKTPCGDIDCLHNCVHYRKGKNMNQVKFTTTLYFDVPENVTQAEQIEYLNNLLNIQPELLLLKIQDIKHNGTWEL